MNVARCIDPREHHLTIAQGYVNGRITARTRDKIPTTRLGGWIARDILSVECGETEGLSGLSEPDG